MAEKSGEYYHRWFDSGDLDSLAQFEAIIEVARRTPDVKHWLPTREIQVVKSYKGEIPANLVVRVSAPMVGQKPVSGFNNTSTVHVKGETVHGQECVAYKQGNACLDCRACWDKNVSNVSYKKH